MPSERSYREMANKKSHKEKHKKRERKSSRSPSKQSTTLIQTLEERRIKEKIERKRLKEELKSKETTEEKRARRLHEKQAKELRRRQRMGWDTEYQHYTNQDNPFGDSNLTSTFVWNKKLEKEGLTDVSLETVEVLSRQKQFENKIELEKVKKRRLERELERQNREEEAVMQQRSKEAAQFKEWERQEEQFHLEQARLRSIIRIQDGRAKPIDLLAQYITNSKLEETIEMQMHEPYLILNGLEVQDLEDLLVDIKVYLELDKGNNNEFWNDMTVIVEDELHKIRKRQADDDMSSSSQVGRREGIHQSVVKDVTETFRGKSTKQLDELRTRIENKINARSEGVDVSYWESLLSQLKAHMARSRLRERHQENLKLKLEMLKVSDGMTKDRELANIKHESKYSNFHDTASAISNSENDTPQSNLLDVGFRLYEEGNYSPIYLTFSEDEISRTVLDQKEDEQKLSFLRSKITKKILQGSAMTREEVKMREEAKRDITTDEAEFSVETPIGVTVQLASDKHRPRKPRYFNRVHTGFEWNKYNQTHYDMDNPPPKIVQGYKFNIFYPDLINKSVTPQYFLTACEDNPDFAVLRFHAGPPYEDIAFKIVNREWEFSYKRGFRCQFHNNVFQLWFHFKRYRYRR